MRRLRRRRRCISVAIIIITLLFFSTGFVPTTIISYYQATLKYFLLLFFFSSFSMHFQIFYYRKSRDISSPTVAVAMVSGGIRTFRPPVGIHRSSYDFPHSFLYNVKKKTVYAITVSIDPRLLPNTHGRAIIERNSAFFSFFVDRHLFYRPFKF